MLFILECVSGFKFILQQFLSYYVLGLRSSVIKVKHFSYPRFVGVYIIETSMYSDLNNKCHCRIFKYSLHLL
jgi:hypothetical protein